MSAAESVWDGATPVNATGSGCGHDACTGLICTARATLPPRWADVPPAREPGRVYARVLGADVGDDPGGAR